MEENPLNPTKKRFLGYWISWLLTEIRLGFLQLPFSRRTPSLSLQNTKDSVGQKMWPYKLYLSTLMYSYNTIVRVSAYGYRINGPYQNPENPG